MVVLPQPLGPTIATNSDCAISRSMSAHASTEPFRVLYFLATPCRRICGSVIGSHKILDPHPEERPKDASRRMAAHALVLRDARNAVASRAPQHEDYEYLTSS